MENDDRKQEENPDGAVLFDSDSLHENLYLANIHYDGNRPGEIGRSSKDLASLIKRLVRKLTSWYLEPALDGQRVFNADITRTANELERYAASNSAVTRDLGLAIERLEAGRRDLEIRLGQLEDILARETGLLPLPPKHLRSASSVSTCPSSSLQATRCAGSSTTFWERPVRNCQISQISWISVAGAGGPCERWLSSCLPRDCPERISTRRRSSG